MNQLAMDDDVDPRKTIIPPHLPLPHLLRHHRKRKQNRMQILTKNRHCCMVVKLVQLITTNFYVVNVVKLKQKMGLNLPCVMVHVYVLFM